MLTQLTGTNTEIDIYGCLVRKLEAKVGCQLERSVRDYQSNRTWAKPNACLEFDKVVQETMRQDKWLESSLAEHGCMPSCRRDTAKIKEVTTSSMNSTFVGNFIREEKVRNRIRLRYEMNATSRSFAQFCKKNVLNISVALKRRNWCWDVPL